MREMYLGNCEELDCEHFSWCGDSYGDRNTECYCSLNGKSVFRFDAEKDCIVCPMGKVYDEDEYEDFVNVSQIKVTAKNPTLNEICNALNMYLQKNKGAASDFHLMKDVVERYCDAEEEEISVQQPIPLYLGLMGTMIGIIVGIGFIAMSGGLSSDSLMDNITSLMTCVAIAMAASLVGIFCTEL